MSILTGLHENYLNISGRKSQKGSTGQDSFSISQLLATSYCFCSLLLTIIQAPLRNATEKSDLIHSNVGRLELENEWNRVQNSLSLVSTAEVTPWLHSYVLISIF